MKKVKSVKELDFASQGKVFPSPRDWRDVFIYFLLVDRFDNNSVLNTWIRALNTQNRHYKVENENDRRDAEDKRECVGERGSEERVSAPTLLRLYALFFLCGLRASAVENLTVSIWN